MLPRTDVWATQLLDKHIGDCSVPGKQTGATLLPRIPQGTSTVPCTWVCPLGQMSSLVLSTCNCSQNGSAFQGRHSPKSESLLSTSPKTCKWVHFYPFCRKYIFSSCNTIWPVYVPFLCWAPQSGFVMVVTPGQLLSWWGCSRQNGQLRADSGCTRLTALNKGTRHHKSRSTRQCRWWTCQSWLWASLKTDQLPIPVGHTVIFPKNPSSLMETWVAGWVSWNRENQYHTALFPSTQWPSICRLNSMSQTSRRLNELIWPEGVIVHVPGSSQHCWRPCRHCSEISGPRCGR